MHVFAETCEKIAGTTKKLEKERILANYLHSLTDEDLAIAAIFMSGSPFALREQRTTNAGFAVVRDALLEIAPHALEKFGPALLQTGDPGTAVREILKIGNHNVPATLRLLDVREYYYALGETGSLIKKRGYTREILERATPLEAQYITKILLGGMRIGLQESLVESSIAKAFNKTLKEVQLANMLIGDIGETALMARAGKLDQAQMQLLHPIKPMLASAEEDVSKILEYMDGTGLAEDKYDGIRAQVHKDGDEIRIYSRDLDDITASFPDIVSAMALIPGSFLMDGEIVPYRDEQILSFAELQIRLGRKLIAKEILDAVPTRYFAFDLLYINGELLISQPLTQRKSQLFSIWEQNQTSFSPSTSVIVQDSQGLEESFEAARERNNEGLVIKHPDSTYTPGKRGKTWFKLKRTLASLDVVVVTAEYGHGKRAGVLSDYTFAVQHKGELLTIGKAYSGITDVELQQLSSLFHEISLGNRGYYHPVKPQVVLEVTFDRINRSDRHSSGFALRFPRIKRIRWDKKPDEIDTLETVENLHKTHFGG